MPGLAFYFEYNRQVVMLPVNPEALEVSYPGQNQTTEIIGTGEINILRSRKLAALTIACYFPLRPDYPWILTKNQFREPKFYIDFFRKVQADKKPMRLVVTGTEIQMDVAIEGFTRSNIAQDDDISYSLELREYRAYSAKEVVIVTPKTEVKFNAPPPEPKAVVKTTTNRANTTNAVTIGSNVIVNGQLHLDSDGRGPGAVRKGYAGKINYIKKGKPFPYHVTTPTGAPQGWVKASAVQVKSQ